jgi:olfactory receptor
MGIARMACDSIKVNIYYGMTVALTSLCSAIIISYALILCSAFKILSVVEIRIAIQGVDSH